DLVLVSRADAAGGGPDLPFASSSLGQQIEVPVVGKDQVRLVADHEPPLDVDSVSGQLIDLGEERLQIDDDAVPDDAGQLAMQNAGGDEAQHEFRAVDVHGVSCVVPALVPCHDIEARGEQIDHLTFSFVAPLRAEYGEIHSRHRFYLEDFVVGSPCGDRR